MEFRCQVKHSDTKKSFNVLNTVLGMKRKLCSVQYAYDDKQLELSSRSKIEAYEHAVFIAKCFNNKDLIDKNLGI